MNNPPSIFVEHGSYKTYVVRLTLAHEGSVSNPIYRYLANPQSINKWANGVTNHRKERARRFKTVESAVEAIKAYRLNGMPRLFAVVDVVGDEE